jgi:hypothetical protein
MQSNQSKRTTILAEDKGSKVVTENQKILEAILMQIGQINANITRLADRVEVFTTDLREFSERFEDVVTQLEDERRLDRLEDYN